VSDLPAPKDPLSTAVEKGIEEAAKAAKVAPLLEAGSLEEDNDMRDRWANDLRFEIYSLHFNTQRVR
jgi:hypothetical protein